MWKTFKTEAVRLGFTTSKEVSALVDLTNAKVLANAEKDKSGITLDDILDARDKSEIANYVFPPGGAAARAELDKIDEHNASQTDNKKRISKKVAKVLFQKKTNPDGKLTLEEAQKLVNPTGLKATTTTRTPGGQTNQTATTPTGKEKKKTAKEIEDERVTALIAIFKAAALDEYSQDDCDSLVQRAYDEGEIFPEDEDEDRDPEENESDPVQ